MKKHILLIDDDQDELDILKMAMRLLKFPAKCTWVQSAEHAMQVLSFVEPDYILVDYNMPKTNGVQCVAKLKQLNVPSSIKIVLYSTHISKEVQKKASDAGVDICVQKPSNVEELKMVLETLFDQKEAI